ncbi:MAG: alpha/beta fold hydrolase [Rhodobacteraceae bacterium]|jgi:pimeloyl-ACP methyl ester carboxylesterase|nr:alpha/beta fold hydrolase [uncultured Defluviimonas sp.]MCB2125237.1 alpha/beta fold hydrolase [Paracoccaceae bacterium]MCC0071058.1 alpha/beta fold hydrolase [Paracoccaceae bacterium]
MQLAYTRAGTGTPLVLVHGYLGGAAMWQGQVTALAARHDVICPDLAGFGESAGLVAPTSIAGHAEAVLGLLDDLGIARFDLLGHSMGGMVVQEMVRRAPSRVGKLVLYGTGPQGVLPGRFESIAESRASLLEQGMGPTARRIAATWFLQGEAAEGFALCAALGQKVSLTTALACLDAWEGWDGRAALAEIRTPTMVIWGSHDRSYNWSQPEALWRGIAGADLAVVPGAAHNVHLEKPALFNAVLADFLQAAG